MNQAPVSCVPVPKMSKARKIVEEAKETKNPELDLGDKGLTAFEELPGLCKLLTLDPLIRQTLGIYKILWYRPCFCYVT